MSGEGIETLGAASPRELRLEIHRLRTELRAKEELLLGQAELLRAVGRERGRTQRKFQKLRKRLAKAVSLESSVRGLSIARGSSLSRAFDAMEEVCRGFGVEYSAKLAPIIGLLVEHGRAP